MKERKAGVKHKSLLAKIEHFSGVADAQNRGGVGDKNKGGAEVFWRQDFSSSSSPSKSPQVFSLTRVTSVKSMLTITHSVVNIISIESCDTEKKSPESQYFG